MVEWTSHRVCTSKLLEKKKKKNLWSTEISLWSIFVQCYMKGTSKYAWVRDYLFLWLMEYFGFHVKERISIRIQSGSPTYIYIYIYSYSNIIIVPRAELQEIVGSWQKWSRLPVSKLWMPNDLYRLKTWITDFSKNCFRGLSDHPPVCGSVQVVSALEYLLYLWFLWHSVI